MADAVVTAAVRTTIGTFGGALKDVEAHRIGGRVIESVLQRSEVSPAEVDEVVMGSIYQGGGAGPNLARQASVVGGIPYEDPSMTVNKLCGAAMLVMSQESARSRELKPLGYIRASAQAGVDPKIMGIGPARRSDVFWSVREWRWTRSISSSSTRPSPLKALRWA